MRCQTSDYQLTLGDLRRLVSETLSWSDKCCVQVFTSTAVDRITVEELDTDRRQQGAAKTLVKAPGRAAAK
jgi:hypothetical protein